MRPSFFGLFKRGQYFRNLPRFAEDGITESDGFSEQRKELERFVVAAIGFTVRHDAEFAQHFARKICQGNAIDAAANRTGNLVIQKCELALEMRDLDFVLKNQTPSGEEVYVLEVKAGAPLAVHQNPSRREFWAKANAIKGGPAGKRHRSGYGYEICRHFPSAIALYYIILGHDKRIENAKPPPTGMTSAHWDFRQRSWADLAKDFPESNLAVDLKYFLTQVQIASFMQSQIDSRSLSTEAENAVDAYIVLRDTCNHFGIRHRIDVGKAAEGTSWQFGMNIGFDLGTRPLELIQPKDHRFVCWFGYEKNEEAGFRTSIWFYCETKDAAEAIKKKLGGSLGEPKVDRETGYVYICKTKSLLCDVDWFTRVFETVGLPPV